MSETEWNLVMSKIENANEDEIERIIQAVVRRYDRFFPDWEVVFLSLPRNDPQQRKQILAYAQELFQKTGK